MHQANRLQAEVPGRGEGHPVCGRCKRHLTMHLGEAPDESAASGSTRSGGGTPRLREKYAAPGYVDLRSERGHRTAEVVGISRPPQ